jgi:uncharacterized protein
MNIKIWGFGLAITSLLSLGLVGCATVNDRTKVAKDRDTAVTATTTQTDRSGNKSRKFSNNDKLNKNRVVYSGDAPISPEQSPESVINAVYQGVQTIHSDRGTPELKWGMTQGAEGGCGAINGSHYCKLDHTIYITDRDIQMAYQHGDAALAYIIGHEYAHAMQTAFGFQPDVTPISELQADCLSGLYLGTIPDVTFDRQDIDEIRTIAYRLGDYGLAHPNHHGTPAQRLKAVEVGIQGAIDGRDFSVCQVE